MRWVKRKDAKKGASFRGKPARRRPAPRWVRQAIRGACLVLVFGTALGGPAWLWQSGWMTQAANDIFMGVARRLGDAGLRVGQIYLHGRDHESDERIRRALGIERGTPLLAVDLDAARRRVENLPWVRIASVEREYPDAIRVRIVEREPLALWQRDNRLMIVDAEGVVIDDDRMRHFPHLLVIVGEDAPAHARTLLSILAREPDLKQRVNAAVRVGDRRWNIRMDNGVFVRLPERDALDAWRRFARLERVHGLLKQDLLSIDLRIPDQLIVRTRPGHPALERKISVRKGKET